MYEIAGIVGWKLLDFAMHASKVSLSWGWFLEIFFLFFTSVKFEMKFLKVIKFLY